METYPQDKLIAHALPYHWQAAHIATLMQANTQGHHSLLLALRLMSYDVIVQHLDPDVLKEPCS